MSLPPLSPRIPNSGLRLRQEAAPEQRTTLGPPLSLPAPPGVSPGPAGGPCPLLPPGPRCQHQACLPDSDSAQRPRGPGWQGSGRREEGTRCQQWVHCEPRAGTKGAGAGRGGPRAEAAGFLDRGPGAWERDVRGAGPGLPRLRLKSFGGGSLRLPRRGGPHSAGGIPAGAAAPRKKKS